MILINDNANTMNIIKDNNTVTTLTAITNTTIDNKNNNDTNDTYSSEHNNSTHYTEQIRQVLPIEKQSQHSNQIPFPFSRKRRRRDRSERTASTGALPPSEARGVAGGGVHAHEVDPTPLG